MKHFVLFFYVALLYSCSTDPVENLVKTSENTSDQNHMVFEDIDGFLKVYDQLSQYDHPEEMTEWTEKNSHPSLDNHLQMLAMDTLYVDSPQDSINRQLSIPLKSILNKDSEIKIGGEIIKLVGDELQYIHVNKDKVLGKVSQAGLSNRVTLNFNLGQNQLIGTNRSFSAINGVTCATIPSLVNGGRNRRLINEFYNETILDANGYTLSSKVFLRMRMEAEYCSFWTCRWENNEDEKRSISIDLGGIINPQGPFPKYINLDLDYDCVDGTIEFLLADLCPGTPLSPCITAPLEFEPTGTLVQRHYSNFNSTPTFVWTQDVAQDY